MYACKEPDLKQSLMMLARDWRAGELRVLAAALVIAVASITGVSFFADRVSRGLARDATQLLGAYLVLMSDRPWRNAVADEIVSRGLERASGVGFMSMVTGNGQSSLAGVKAVTENYPLRGKLRIAPAPGQPDAPAARGPARGTVWLEERLVTVLGRPVGSRVKVGRAELEVAAILTLEPERSTNFFNIAPRLMMNEADLAATDLIQPGSRVWYYLYAAGAPDGIAALEGWARPKLERGQRVDTFETGRPEVKNSVDRAKRFLSLTALLAAILAGVAIALGTRRFVERHLDGCAVMRCLGATQSQLMRLYGVEFLVLGLAACAAGCLAGYAVQAAIGATMANLLRADLPAPGLLPAAQGCLVGLVLLLGFALPPLLQLKGVPAVRVLRRETGNTSGVALASYLAGGVALAALLIWQAGDMTLGGYVIGGFAAAVLVFFAVAWGALKLLTSRRTLALIQGSNPVLRHGLANLRRHARGNAVQVASLALGLTAVLLLTFTRNDLVDAWRRTAPADAPNRFLMCVQADQVAPIDEFFTERGLKSPELFPMVRGRFVELNGKPVVEGDYTEERARRLVEREFNLSYMAEPPAHNAIVAGRWFAPDAAEVSVEEGIAKALGWKLGDDVAFSVGGETFKAK